MLESVPIAPRARSVPPRTCPITRTYQAQIAAASQYRESGDWGVHVGYRSLGRALRVCVQARGYLVVMPTNAIGHVRVVRAPKRCHLRDFCSSPHIPHSPLFLSSPACGCDWRTKHSVHFFLLEAKMLVVVASSLGRRACRVSMLSVGVPLAGRGKRARPKKCAEVKPSHEKRGTRREGSIRPFGAAQLPTVTHSDVLDMFRACFVVRGQLGTQRVAPVGPLPLPLVLAGWLVPSSTILAGGRLEGMGMSPQGARSHERAHIPVLGGQRGWEGDAAKGHAGLGANGPRTTGLLPTNSPGVPVTWIHAAVSWSFWATVRVGAEGVFLGICTTVGMFVSFPISQGELRPSLL